MAAGQTFGLRCPQIFKKALKLWDGTRGGGWSRVISQPGPPLELLLLALKMRGWSCNLGTLEGRGGAEVSDGQVPRLKQVFVGGFGQQGVNTPLYLFLIIYETI